MNAGRSSGVLRLAGSLLLFCLYTSPPTAFGAACAPVAARNEYERTIMEASSDKQGCWVRDPNTGTLDFLSDVAPSQGYKPLIQQPGRSAPMPAKPKERILSHGVTKPSSYPMLLGTWRGMYCGLSVGTLRFAQLGSSLTGEATFQSYAENQECDATKGDICYGSQEGGQRACAYLEPHLVGEPQRISLTNPGFDGRVLWFTVIGQGQGSEAQMEVFGDKLLLSRDPREPPTVFTKSAN